ncbi:hypothetical protein CDV31_017329 [Fusarium ambrosium]|uniref:Uncharacterized protein n=1 Tax=Fusarium ambrosium TaxID=131363 RepID=A0A428RIP9_9HYPO|nr:hypothetical protein CDV31_017329 [Fusarium ambrosium]
MLDDTKLFIAHGHFSAISRSHSIGNQKTLVGRSPDHWATLSTHPIDTTYQINSIISCVDNHPEDWPDLGNG